MAKGIKLDIKGIWNSPWASSLTKQLGTYEKRMRDVVKDLDVLSKDARTKGKRQLDRISVEWKSRRGDLERKVKGLVNKEAKRLNTRVSKVLGYVEEISREEKRKASAKMAKRKSARSGASRSSKRAKFVRPMQREIDSKIIGATSGSGPTQSSLVT